jgi:hypothetical protein
MRSALLADFLPRNMELRTVVHKNRDETTAVASDIAAEQPRRSPFITLAALRLRPGAPPTIR